MHVIYLEIGRENDRSSLGGRLEISPYVFRNDTSSERGLDYYEGCTGSGEVTVKGSSKPRLALKCAFEMSGDKRLNQPQNRNVERLRLSRRTNSADPIQGYRDWWSRTAETDSTNPKGSMRDRYARGHVRH